jgi:peptide methionine sulfoxide reductase msrA/msrB
MNWKDVLQLTQNNPAPPRRVEKTDDEWRKLLSREQYQVTRLHGTERPFSGEYCELYTPGIYACVCCETELFDSQEKFKSTSGWPSFTAPVTRNVIRYKMDKSYGMQRIEVLCNVCDAHLGHVFPDGPPPSGLRFCINSASLKKLDAAGTKATEDKPVLETATLGGGCFWCTEAVFDELAGVEKVTSGYSGGKTPNPTYAAVCSGSTLHAEVVQVEFNPQIISYEELLRVFLATHNPTTRNRQGADVGTQYRSIILYHNEAQQQQAQKVINELQEYYDSSIVTEIVPFKAFYEAEEVHRDYYRNNPDKAYCRAVISPKLQKLRTQFGASLKRKTVNAGK